MKNVLTQAWLEIVAIIEIDKYRVQWSALDPASSPVLMGRIQRGRDFGHNIHTSPYFHVLP